MKTKEIKKLTQDQLFSELEKLKKEQFNIRFKKKNGQVKFQGQWSIYLSIIYHVLFIN